MEIGQTVIQSLKSHYESGTSDLAQDFFLPCLACCSSYRRAVGYFSSSSLITWAQVLPKVVRSGDLTIQLLASPQLSDADRSALREASTTPGRDKIMRELADRIVTDAIKFSQQPSDVGLRMRLLSWMVAK